MTGPRFVKHTHRPLYRVVRSGWTRPLDVSFSWKTEADNRWNTPDFPALYCCCSEPVARTVTVDVLRLYDLDPKDLQPDVRPQLVELSWSGEVVDISSAEGVRAAGVPPDCPRGTTKQQTRQAAAGWQSAGAHGVVSRSASLSRLGFSKWDGDHQPWSELAIFTRNSPRRPRLLRRRQDLAWLSAQIAPAPSV